MLHVNNIIEYQKISSYIKSLTIWDSARLQRNTQTVYFDWLEYGVKRFWPFLKALIQLSNDQYVYFHDISIAEHLGIPNQFSFFPVMKLNVGMTSEEYSKALQHDPINIPGRSFCLSGTSEYCIIPPSLKWYIYGTYEIELAKLVTTVGIPGSPPFPHDFISENEAKRLIGLLSEEE